MVDVDLPPRGDARELRQDALEDAQVVHARQEAAAGPLAREAAQQLGVHLGVVGGPRRERLGRLGGLVAGVGVEVQPLPVGRGEEPDQRRRRAAQHVLVDQREAAAEDLELAPLQVAVGGAGRLAAHQRHRLLGAGHGGRRRDGAPAAGRLRLQAAVDDGVAGHQHRLGGQVVVAHELLHGRALLGVDVAHGRGHLGLDVEGELVVLAPGEEVQLVANPPDEVAGAAHLADLPLRQQGPVEQVADAGHLEADPGRPERALQVAQAALRRLDVGLQQVERVAEPLPPLAHLGQLVAEELVDLGLREAVQLLPLQRPEQRLVPGQVAQVEQRGARRVVLAGEPVAALEIADPVAHLEVQVPERVEELLAGRLDEAVRPAVGVEHQQVDVAVGVELPPAVAAQGHQRHR